MATDPETGRTEAKRVRLTIAGGGQKNLVDVTVTGGRSTGTVVAKGTWVDAGRLESGGSARVDGTRVWATPQQWVHNLTIADFHTYYVLVGETPLLAHNVSCPIGFTDDTVVDAFTGVHKGGGHAMPAKNLAKWGLL